MWRRNSPLSGETRCRFRRVAGCPRHSMPSRDVEMRSICEQPPSRASPVDRAHPTPVRPRALSRTLSTGRLPARWMPWCAAPGILNLPAFSLFSFFTSERCSPVSPSLVSVYPDRAHRCIREHRRAEMRAPFHFFGSINLRVITPVFVVCLFTDHGGAERREDQCGSSFDHGITLLSLCGLRSQENA